MCIVNNEGGETQDRITIHIQGKFFIWLMIFVFFSMIEIPQVYVYPQTIIYSNEWNITLTCVGMTGIPRPLLIWRRQNSLNPIEQSSKIQSQNGILTIMMATKDDDGIQIPNTPMNFLLFYRFLRVYWK